MMSQPLQSANCVWLQHQYHQSDLQSQSHGISLLVSNDIHSLLNILSFSLFGSFPLSSFSLPLISSSLISSPVLYLLSSPLLSSPFSPFIPCPLLSLLSSLVLSTPFLSFPILSQVERKRHIGNDIVSIVFQEGDDASPSFKPSMIRSHFTRIPY